MKFKTIQKIFLVAMCSSVLYACSEDELTDDTKKEPQSNVLSISSADELFDFAQRVKNGETKLDAELVADIDLTGKLWTPIATNFQKSYEGYFKGNKHTITGLTITEEHVKKVFDLTDEDINYSYPLGLFSYLGDDGIITGVILKDVSIQTPNIHSVAGIAGVNEGTITTCTVSGKLAGNREVAGIAASTYNAISGCENYADIKGSSQVGGIAGTAMKHIMSCKNYGKIEADDEAGGIVGTCGTKAILFNLENYGEVTVNSGAGGITGLVAGKLYNSVNYGAITGSYDIGGVVGKLDRANITGLEFSYDNPDDAYMENCVNYGVVQGGETTNAVIGGFYEKDPFDHKTRVTLTTKNIFYDANVNPTLTDERGTAIDSNTLSTLNQWVDNKPAEHKNVAFKIWEKDENGKFVIKKK